MLETLPRRRTKPERVCCIFQNHFYKEGQRMSSDGIRIWDAKKGKFNNFIHVFYDNICHRTQFKLS
ncbi:hypothetical protein HanRHA438_Chr07g0317081 [Helianthus annuus]|nr:hypothetical protein HanRHA438_Chr07g0317081 [Helianthus annuus]